MKTLLLLSLFALSTQGAFSQEGQPAELLLQNALSLAKKEHKNVFVWFTSTWCGPCKDLKKSIYDVYNIDFFDKNYVLLPIYSNEFGAKKSLENPGGRDLLKRYNGDTTGIPYWFILNTDGKKLHGAVGYSYDDDYLKGFMQVLKKTSKLNDRELQLILERIKQVSRLTREDD